MTGAAPSRRTVVAGLGALAASAPLRAAAATAPIALRGNRFFLGDAPLRLTGVAVGDPTYIRARRPRSDYRVIAQDWRANCVRISVHPGLWRRDRDGQRAALAAEVAAARAEGLFVIIDWHRIGFPGHYDPVLPADWGLPVDAATASLAESVAFWREIAGLHGHDPAILFEIWNEPSIHPRFWKATGEHWPLFKAAWTEIIAAIRQRSNAIVLAAGGFWAHDLVGVKDDPIADARTAYVWHCYPNAERDDMAARIATLGGLQAVRPIVVTEWGFSPEARGDLHGAVEDFGAPLVREVLDAFGLSHTAWCYSVGAMPNLLASEEGAPSVAGRFVRDLLRRSAGAPEWRLAW